MHPAPHQQSYPPFSDHLFSGDLPLEDVSAFQWGMPVLFMAGKGGDL